MSFFTFSVIFRCFKSLLINFFLFQIFLLLFLLLYLLSFALLGRFKRRGKEDYYSSDEDEVMVYRISTWLCSFSLAVSVGAVLLLPISIISNEVLVNYPNSYYIKWLNSSLIQGERFGVIGMLFLFMLRGEVHALDLKNNIYLFCYTKTHFYN